MLFSDVFKISKQNIEDYGAIDLSLASDTPLYIDPLLIYNNDDVNIRNQYQNIVKYLLFLNKQAKKDNSKESIKYYFTFKEIKNNWLGVSKNSNVGSALGFEFGQELYDHINQVCENNNVSNTIHIEKMFLLNKGVGKDKISDMVTNILLEFLVDYTEKFAKLYINSNQCQFFSITKCKFNYDEEIFVDKRVYLPYVINKKGLKEFVLLTPSSILRKEEQEINYLNMISSFENINATITNENLRYQVNKIIENTIDELYEAKKRSKCVIKQSEIDNARFKGIESAIIKYPELFDYFIKLEEENTDLLKETAAKEVNEIKCKSIENEMILRDCDLFGFSSNVEFENPRDEALFRINFLKTEIEVNGLWKNLYYDDKPISQESELQRLFRLVWCRTRYRFSPETNRGVGPVDFQLSFGNINTCNIEFKLASNSKLKNVFAQVEQYGILHNVKESIIVVFSFNDNEMRKAKELQLEGVNKNIDVVIVDCNKENKVSASNAK